MKPKFILLLFLLVATACKKNDGQKSNNSTVTISGDAYPTIKIGQQEWTTVNYNGPGGKAENFFVKNPNFKRYYTLSDVASLKLPDGWRIPTMADYNKLLSNFTTSKDTEGQYVASLDQSLALKSTSGWDMPSSDDKQGSNTSGFNAYPAGYYTDFPANNYTPGNFAMFLTSTPLPDDKKNFHATSYSFILTRLYLNRSSDNLTECFGCFVDGDHNTDLPKSVRFVRDL